MPAADFMQVSLSTCATQKLQDAAEALYTTAAADITSPSICVRTIQALDSALRVAERELFESLMRGPLFRFVQQRAQFKAWAMQTRAALSVAAAPRGGKTAR